MVLRWVGAQGYVAITTGMKIYSHVFELLLDGSLSGLDNALAASDHWRVFFRNQDAVTSSRDRSGSAQAANLVARWGYGLISVAR